MQEAIIFPENVEVGKYYLVPHVKNSFHEWIPINSYLHEDIKVIKFEQKHWHIDWRFVRDKLYKDQLEPFEFSNYPSLMEAKTIICLLEAKERKLYGDGRFNTWDSTIYYKRVRCKRNYSANTFHNDHPSKYSQWPTELSKQFCQAKLKRVDGMLLCPHKGIAIDPNCKDENGNYVCPGHLLKFNPVTLSVVQ